MSEAADFPRLLYGQGDDTEIEGRRVGLKQAFDAEHLAGLLAEGWAESVADIPDNEPEV